MGFLRPALFTLVLCGAPAKPACAAVAEDALLLQVAPKGSASAASRGSSHERAPTHSEGGLVEQLKTIATHVAENVAKKQRSTKAHVAKKQETEETTETEEAQEEGTEQEEGSEETAEGEHEEKGEHEGKGEEDGEHDNNDKSKKHRKEEQDDDNDSDDGDDKKETDEQDEKKPSKKGESKSKDPKLEKHINDVLKSLEAGEEPCEEEAVTTKPPCIPYYTGTVPPELDITWSVQEAVTKAMDAMGPMGPNLAAASNVTVVAATTTTTTMETTQTVSPEIQAIVERALNDSATKALADQIPTVYYVPGYGYSPYSYSPEPEALPIPPIPDCSEEVTAEVVDQMEPLPEALADAKKKKKGDDDDDNKKKGDDGDDEKKDGKDDDKKKDKKDAAAVEQSSDEHARSRLKTVFAEALKETLKETLMNTGK